MSNATTLLIHITSMTFLPPSFGTGSVRNPNGSKLWRRELSLDLLWLRSAPAPAGRLMGCPKRINPASAFEPQIRGMLRGSQSQSRYTHTAAFTRLWRLRYRDNVQIFLNSRGSQPYEIDGTKVTAKIQCTTSVGADRRFNPRRFQDQSLQP